VDLLGVLVEGVAVLDVLLDLNLRPTVDQIHELVVFLTRVYITASQSFVIFLPRKEIFYLVFPDFQGKFHMYVERSVESTFSVGKNVRKIDPFVKFFPPNLVRFL
jgi:hypothetical protein